MGTCALCKKSSIGISLLGANHKEFGYLMVCQECWRKLSDENSMIAGSSCSGKCSGCSR